MNSLEQKLPVSNALTYLDLKGLKPLFKTIKYKVTFCLISPIKPAKLGNAATCSNEFLKWWLCWGESLRLVGSLE